MITHYDLNSSRFSIDLLIRALALNDIVQFLQVYKKRGVGFVVRPNTSGIIIVPDTSRFREVYSEKAIPGTFGRG